MRLRCWARRGRDGVLCEERHGRDVMHYAPPGHDCGLGSWSDGECAPDAGPDGRETASLRLLEVAHEADRIIFVDSVPVREWPEMLRAMAARLFANTDAVRADIATLNGEIGQGERYDECYSAADPFYVFTRKMLVALRAARDILRPFAVKS